MNIGSDLLKANRLTELIGQVERGEPVNFDRLATLQTLDLVRAGQLFAIDAFDHQEQENARITELLTQFGQ